MKSAKCGKDVILPYTASYNASISHLLLRIHHTGLDSMRRMYKLAEKGKEE